MREGAHLLKDLKARIAVRPSEEAWRVVDAVIRDRPKGFLVLSGDDDDSDSGSETTTTTTDAKGTS